MSEEEYQNLISRRKVVDCTDRNALLQVSAAPNGLIIAKATNKPFKGNKTEAAYMALLETKKRAGEVIWYAFEAITLKLADDTRYTPDFAVIMADMTIEMHEVKGFWRDDARVKIKVAAEMFPFRFIAIKKAKGESWEVEKF